MVSTKKHAAAKTENGRKSWCPEAWRGKAEVGSWVRMEKIRGLAPSVGSVQESVRCQLGKQKDFGANF